MNKNQLLTYEDIKRKMTMLSQKKIMFYFWVMDLV